MSISAGPLEYQYLSCLRAYLRGEEEQSLAHAYDVGRKANAEGRGILGLLAVHQRALDVALHEAMTRTDASRATDAAHCLLYESLASFEMTNRGFRDSLDALRKSNAALSKEMARRKETERDLQVERDKILGILNSMEDGVCIMAPDFGVEYINPSMQSLYGETGGRECYRYFNGRDDVCPWCNNADVLEGGRIVRREVESNRTGRRYEVTDAPLRNSDGTIWKLAVWHDITERKKMEDLKDEFIGMVSHELKTPLTIIMGDLATAMDNRVPVGEIRGLLADALTSTELLAGIVENLLELSRQQSNRLFLQATPSNIDEIARMVIKKLEGKSELHRIVGEFPPGLPQALVDPLRAERILYNLIENAIKYSPEGGEVRVSAREGIGFVLVGVSDQGPGISSDDQVRLFESFERLGVTAKGSIQGTGLGLRVCRILVEAHGGAIWVESEKGKGATFYFTVPIS